MGQEYIETKFLFQPITITIHDNIYIYKPYVTERNNDKYNNGPLSPL